MMAGAALPVCLLAGILSSTSVLASTWQATEMTCPYDGTKFTFEQQMSAATFGAMLDLEPFGAIRSPWPMAVCPTNGFVFFQDTFDANALERLRPLVLSPAYQALKGERPYYRAAWLMQHTGAAHVDVTFELLEATWEAEGDPPRYARYAAELAARLPEDIAVASDDRRPELRRLPGEIARRLGRFDEARRDFDALSKDLTPTSTEGLIAAFERELIDKRDVRSHRESEAVERGESDPAIWRARRTPALSGAPMLRQSHMFKFDSGRTLDWMQDGRLIGTTDTGLSVFDLSTETIKPLDAPVIWSERAEVSKVGKAIVFQSSDRTRIVEADTATFEPIHSATVPSPGSQRVVTDHENKAAVVELGNRLVAFDLGTGTLRPLASPVFEGGDTQWWLEAADPAGPRVVLNHEQTIVVWNYATRTITHQIRPTGWTSTTILDDAIYARDGATLFVVADALAEHECELTAWDARSGRQLSQRRVKGEGASLALSPDGSTIALGCGPSLVLLDPISKVTSVVTAQDGVDIRDATFSPDSRALALQIKDAVIVYALDRSAAPRCCVSRGRRHEAGHQEER